MQTLTQLDTTTDYIDKAIYKVSESERKLNLMKKPWRNQEKKMIWTFVCINLVKMLVNQAIPKLVNQAIPKQL